MARPQETFNKREQEKLRAQKRKEKLEKKEARKANPKLSGEDLYVYVDENGHLTSTPPDPSRKIEIDVESIAIGTSRRTAEEEMPEERRGTVDFYNDAKGFGFIIDTENNEKYFCHVSGLIDQIAENDKVSFELERGMKGMNAVKVKKI